MSQTNEAPAEVVVRPKRDWFSGWCGASPDGCADTRKNKVGEVKRRCLYVAENGSKAPIRFLYCACSCHDGERVEDDPNRKGQ